MGLVYHQPDDPVTFLQDCLRTVLEIGWQNVTWKSFIPEDVKDVSSLSVEGIHFLRQLVVFHFHCRH